MLEILPINLASYSFPCIKLCKTTLFFVRVPLASSLQACIQETEVIQELPMTIIESLISVKLKSLYTRWKDDKHFIQFESIIVLKFHPLVGSNTRLT